jgi:hypothetical protein
MANEVTTTLITGAINTSYIEPLMLNYAIDAAVALPYVRVSNVRGRGTKTAQFYVPTKSGGVAALTEGTDAANSALAIAAGTTIAVAEVGIVRNVQKLAIRTNVMGEAELLQFVVEDGTRLVVEKMETDLWAQFPNASTSVGTTTTAFTLANYSAGLSQLGINKARGRATCFLSGKQASDLRDAIVASGSAIFSTGAEKALLSQVADNGYVGNLFGADIYMSNLRTTANAGADGVGAFAIDGSRYPQNAPLGMALAWMPELESLPDPSLRGLEMAVTAAYGFAEISDFNYVKIVTRA